MHYPTVGASTADTQPGAAVHGKYVAMNMCAPCHYNPETSRFTGKKIEGLPRIAGTIRSSSLTNEPNSNIASYSDAELAYLIRTGINRKGHFVPYMMRPNMADEDLNDLIAFLRSKDPTLEPMAGIEARKTKLTLFGKAGMRFATRPQPFRSGIIKPQITDSLALGRYLVDNMGCFHCHSSSATSLNYLIPERTKGYLAGGARFVTRDGSVRGPNITFDKETGIYAYSKEDLRRVLQNGLTRTGTHVKAPAETFPVSDAEADAIYAYLRSVPVRHHKVKGHFQP